MHDYSELADSVEGTFIILSILYLIFLLLSILRWKNLYFNLESKKTFMVMIFFSFLMAHCLARLVCFILSFIIVNNCNNADFTTTFHSENNYLVFMLFFPDITFLTCLLLLYFVMACVVFFGHIPFMSPEKIKLYKQVAKIAWSSVILCYLILELILIILYSREVIGQKGLIIAFSILDIVCPCFILISEIKIHRKTSGLPYKSSIFRNTKNNINYKVFYWIFARFFHAIICLVLLKIEDLNNYVELPKKEDSIKDYQYFMMLGSLGVVFLDKVINEIFPIYLVINQDFMDLIENMKSQKFIKKSLLEKTNVDENNEISFLNSGLDNSQKTNFKMDFSTLNFQEVDYSQISPKGKNKSFGVLRHATCDLIAYSSFLGLENLIVRLIELSTLSPYIIESIVKDCETHQNLQKADPNPNILNLLGYSLERNKIALVYPKISNGNLSDLIGSHKAEPRGQIDDQLKVRIAMNIAMTMKILHSKEVIHGHLTPNNILMDKDFNPKIADLLFYDLKKYSALVIGYQNKTKYTAPEYLKESAGISQNPKPSSDVYSFGIILWELMTEQQAYQNIKMSDLKKMVCEEDSRPKIPEDVPQEMAYLIRCCWQKEAEKRPSFEQIVNNLVKLLDEQENFESFIINT